MKNVNQLPVDLPKVLEKISYWRIEQENEIHKSVKLDLSSKDCEDINNSIESIQKASFTKSFKNKFYSLLTSIPKNGLNRDDIYMYRIYRDRLPLRFFNLIYDAASFRWDNKRIVSRKKIQSGYFMLEIQGPKNSEGLNCAVNQIYDDKSAIKVCSIRIKGGQLTKCLFFSSNDFTLELFFESPITAKCITNLRVCRLTKIFFMDRLFKKLGFDKNSFRESDLDYKAIKYLMGLYYSRFSEYLTKDTEYGKYIEAYEKKIFPTYAKQKSNLLRWKIEVK
jgi:hypothetical protein